jgi:broad specificity phosphatase PhoE
MIAIHLVRHAQASFGAEDYDRLSALGLEQSRVLGEALRPRLPTIDVVVSGSQRRHRETADACLAALGLSPPVRVLPGLDEADHRELLARLDPRYADRAAMAADVAARGGEPMRAFQAIFAAAFDRWMSGGHDGEYSTSWPSFRRRCAAALEEIVRPLPSSANALVFTSGGPIAALCVGLLGVPDDAAARLVWTLVNAGVTKLLHRQDGTRLSTFNEHAHFEGARRRLITYR